MVFFFVASLAIELYTPTYFHIPSLLLYSHLLLCILPTTFIYSQLHLYVLPATFIYSHLYFYILPPTFIYHHQSIHIPVYFYLPSPILEYIYPHQHLLYPQWSIYTPSTFIIPSLEYIYPHQHLLYPQWSIYTPAYIYYTPVVIYVPPCTFIYHTILIHFDTNSTP